MSIKSRLRTIENKIIKTISGYCLCYGIAPRYEAVFDKAAPGRVSKMPDFCDECRKPVDKRSIEISFDDYQKIVQQRRARVETTMAKFAD